jgi:hypothetical protein
MKQYYVYLHCKPDLTPFYVGKGSGRRSSIVVSGRRNLHHKNIVAKYGEENIVIMVFNKDSEESALRSEKRFIKMFTEAGFELANYSTGGESGATGAHWKLSEETKRKQAAAKIGNKNSERSPRNTGHKMSDEQRAIHSDRVKAQWKNPNRRIKSKHSTASL